MATTDDQPTEAKLGRLEALREEALHAGSEKAVQRRREEGRLLARERAERLCDPARSSSSTATSATGNGTSG
ncbi:MAG TPA: hypothetical protein VEH55_00095 [Gaiellaceae bacterium]|nr:hypothetical protein [Gaiellaceae bacterium]